MKTSDAIKHFGTKKDVAAALKISKQAVSQWGELVPEDTAYKLQVITAGRLQVDQSAYRKAGTA